MCIMYADDALKNFWITHGLHKALNLHSIWGFNLCLIMISFILGTVGLSLYTVPGTKAALWAIDLERYEKYSVPTLEDPNLLLVRQQSTQVQWNLHYSGGVGRKISTGAIMRDSGEFLEWKMYTSVV
ncbi:hypothetical protein K435DRAFT_834332 [Dendrothele bispora CBS 962.96]|uniref:Uncharacterized protein n=1 Tax=Dendrothele bispora (strain CBS 962.96) TaxID=1314807 RepID=A0A4S8MTD4_DENBC|nr:hypothetical protein K435DRAFT_834332 [Dendrothele bispora CBS 962.96]